MKIRLVKNPKSDWGFIYGKTIKVLVISFGKYALQLSFGKKPFDAYGYSEFLDKTFNKNCKVCGKSLNVTAVKQNIQWHKQCRKLRHKTNVAKN